MSSILGPTTAAQNPGIVFGPEVLLNDSYLASNLLWQVASTVTEDSNDVDYDHVATPLQEEVYSSGYPQWCQLALALPTDCAKTINKVEATWRTLCVYYPCLRTILYVNPQDGQLHHRVLKRSSHIRKFHPHGHGEHPADKEDPDDQIAYLTINNSQDQSLLVTLHVRRAIVDSTSLGILKFNFALVYIGLPLRNTTSMARYIEHLMPKLNSDKAQEYWCKTLAGANVTRVASSTSQLHVPNPDEIKSISLQLSSATLQQLSQLESRGMLSRKPFFEALWILVLSRHAGSPDVLVAVAERDRSFDGYATCVGGLDQVYPLRIHISEEQRFKDLAKSVDAYHENASLHAHLGHKAILAASGLPIAESLLKYSSAMTYPSMAGTVTNFPIIMFVNDYNLINLTLFYTPDIDVQSAHSILDHYANAIGDTSRKLLTQNLVVQKIELSSDKERKSILEGAVPTNSLESQAPSDIVTWFETQVTSHPSEPAVQYEDEKAVTFAELNNLANRIARVLQIGKQTFIPVCMDRSVDFIACLFAILKSGAAYIVLDPESAPQRNVHIVKDCEAPFVMTNRHYAANFEHVRILEDLEGVHESDSVDPDDHNLHCKFSPDDPCYVIYTSGSTGVPKGVVLTHRAATSGMSFFSLNEEAVTSSLAKIIDSMKADSLGITPSALSLLSPSEVPTLKQITLVGESVGPSLLEKWCNNVELRNTFGLSECTQLNFGRRLYPDSNPRVVGRPSDTTSAFVLRPGSTDLAPLETTGELCLAGPQLGREYLKKPEQTAKAFVPNPFGPGRLYRTGDGARQHRDGAIEIVGRLDFQVKINGQRVEPNEINEALLKHLDVIACATVAATMQNSKSLVAAIVPDKGRGFGEIVADLRRHIKTLLPSYMVPSYWLPKSELPTNANGKVDIPKIRSEAEHLGPQRLLEFLKSEREDTRPFVDEKEITVRKVWSGILQLELSSVHHQDSFVTLGGSSLQAITAVTKLRQNGLSIDLSEVVGSATLDEVAAACTAIDPSASEDSEPFTLIEDISVRERLKTENGTKDAYPVTPLQESLLAASLSGKSGYVYQRTWDMAGVEVEKLRDAIERVFDESDILRTTFLPHGKSHIQVVKADMKLPWKVSSSRLAQYQKSQDDKDVTFGRPLFNVTFVQGRYLVVSMHHSVFDFWSHRFFYQDVSAVFFGSPPIERPPFKRFVKHILRADGKAMDAFWKDYLTGADRAILNNNPVGTQITVERCLDIEFKLKSQALGTTTGSVLYAAWALVLSRHIGTQDVSFATTLSGREAPISDIDRLDGPTLTTVPQRIIIDPTSKSSEFAKSVNSQFFKLMRFAQHGMRRALAAGNRSADCFDTLVNVLVKDQDDELSQRLFKRQGPKPRWSSEYATLEMEELDDECQLRLSSTMEPRRAELLLDSVALAIKAILEYPETEIGQIDILGERERAFLVNKDEIEDVPAHLAFLHARFESFAHTEPERVAIDWNASQNVTYKELNKRADRVAAYLHQHDITRGDVVPLYLDKSIETIVAILGTMKAGAAYVPLSPDNPMERNVYIVKDVGGHMILTQDVYQGVWQNEDIQTANVTDIVSGEDSSPPPSTNRSPEDIAYVIYTSGSTGNPKGVKVPHRSASTAVASMLEAEGRMDGEWRTLQFANYVFDASVQDIFNTLSSGGTLCMAPTEKLLSNLSSTINEMNAMQAILTPTVAKLIEPKDVPGLQTLIVGGEPLTADVVEKWASSRKLLNVYGPTETSMVVTTKGVHANDNPHNIGRPFKTSRVFIMNQNGTDLVPYGAIGELCVAGPQLSDGYLKNSSATDASFTSSIPLGVGRMYKTGDLARWYPNGDLECLGRKDNQVKIHGHRIELGEVEQAVVRTHTVHDTVIIASEVNQKPQLTAVAVFDPTSDTHFDTPDAHREEVGELSEKLEGLPPYMIPKSVVSVGKLPKLPSGKVDRKLLKKWIEEMSATDLNKYSIDKANSTAEVVPVVTEAESDLEKLWSEILGQERGTIGALANFYSLGGDSVSAINLVSACRTTGYRLTVSHVLKSPVLRDMALCLKAADASRIGDADKKFTTPDSLLSQFNTQRFDYERCIDYVYPAPPGQVEFLNQGQRADGYWIMMNIRPFASSTSVEEWIKAVTELTRINDILRTFYFMEESKNEWVGVVLKTPVVDITFHDCQDGNHRSKIVEDIWKEPFGFGKPWIRYAFLVLSDGTREVLIKMDHAVYDGTLLRIFADHFAAIQKQVQIPAHEDFRNFSMHMWRSDKTESLKFWTELMAEHDFVYPVANNPKITALVAKPTDIELDDFATRCSVTPSIVFQTAFQLWLMRHSHQKDIAFDYLLSGRNVELPNPQLINGNLANILPVRSRLPSTPADQTTTLATYLEETQKLFWDVTEQGNVGLDEIFAASNLSRERVGNRAMFLFQPFEPAASGPALEEMRWVVMKGAEVRMFQPYALVVEISKTLSGHLVKVMYDEGVYGEEDAQGIAGEVIGIVEEMMEQGTEVDVEELL